MSMKCLFEALGTTSVVVLVLWEGDIVMCLCGPNVTFIFLFVAFFVVLLSAHALNCLENKIKDLKYIE